MPRVECPVGQLQPVDDLPTSGGGGTYGALVADGDACVSIGSNSLNLGFDANVFNSVSSFGTVGLVQNTWRELQGRLTVQAHHPACR